ncbi:hypothetical protein TSUD_131720 [Trifolium subterraneum]|uniref:Reticulon-like protein n=1 Tax=Trifolium subterraneum TaxID=3900 RepID=A0A2Z6LUN1_TRISU|nr:hypothetical protein TSUD_131720 [Trifolium subterraneum]
MFSLVLSSTGTMSDKITAENLLHNLVDTLSDKPKKVSFFEEDKSKSVRSDINRLFGREKPVHNLLGGGKCTFLWSNASGFFNSTPDQVPRFSIPQELFVNIATVVGNEVNRGLRFLQDVSCEGNLKLFLIVSSLSHFIVVAKDMNIVVHSVKTVASLWAGSVIGSWCNFLTVIYIGIIAAHTLPVLYEKYEDEVDDFVYKVFGQLQNSYSKLDSRVLKGKFKGKKHD